MTIHTLYATPGFRMEDQSQKSLRYIHCLLILEPLHNF